MDDVLIGVILLAIVGILLMLFEIIKKNKILEFIESHKHTREKSKIILHTKKEKKNIGLTIVQIEFVDGSEFIAHIYGRYTPMFIGGYGALMSEQFQSSESVARIFITNLRGGEFTTVCDNLDFAKSVRIGVIKSAKMLETVDCFVEVEVSYVA